MIRKAFRHVISLLSVSCVVGAAGAPSCHDDYTSASFTPTEDAFGAFVDEYFDAARIPFLPSIASLKALGLRRSDPTTYLRPDALHIAGGNRSYPTQPGLWKVRVLGSGIYEYHLLIREPERQSEIAAFNGYNDLLGEPFADYDATAYAMTMLPEDVRLACCGRFVTLNVTLYGILGDATRLDRTVADVVLTDYTEWVRENRRCRRNRHGGRS
jgi:hypothetical protein